MNRDIRRDWTDTPKVITVPGNHDLDRGSVRTAVIRSAKDKYQPNMGTFDPELLGQLLGGFNFYNNMEYATGRKVHNE